MEQERGEEEIGWKERKLFERSKVLNGLSHRHAVSGWKRSSWWAKSNFSKFVGHEAIFKADRSLILWFAMIRFWLMWNLVLHSCGYVKHTQTHRCAHAYMCTDPEFVFCLYTVTQRWQTKCERRQHAADSKRKKKASQCSREHDLFSSSFMCLKTK